MPVITLPNIKLDESCPTPLYFQLRELIADAIQDGQFGPEYQLPSERELANKFQLSRMTVRQATIALVNDGILMRKRGKGTYIAPPKIEQGLLKLTSFTEDMKRRGMKPSTRIISMGQLPANHKIALELGIKPGDHFHMLERLRLADGEPMAYESCHLPLQRFPEISKQELGNQSLYTFLSTRYGLTFKNAQQSLQATVATRREAELLKITKGAPLLLLQRSTQDEQGNIIEFVKSLYRADRYIFHVNLSR